MLKKNVIDWATVALKRVSGESDRDTLESDRTGSKQMSLGGTW